MLQALTKQQRLSRILARLQRTHGRQKWESDGPCLDVLVRNMLAQNTNWVNADNGYKQLRRQFPSWSAVMRADVSEVQRQIAVCGLARMRARRLQAILHEIKRQHGKLCLQHLADQPAEQAYAYLMSFFGIGPKTATCTLLFAFGTPLFPIDNGILRVLRRLRLVRPKAREEEAAQTIIRHTSPRQRYPLHVVSFMHARKFCRPKNPKCDECQLVDLCPHGKRRLKHRPAELVETEAARLRPIILSKFISGGIAKNSDDELVG
jgi:endonuclease-3